jgi:hypothetical protein
MDIHDLIEKFNDGDTDFIKYVNDVGTFFKIVDRRGLLDELDPEGKLADEYQNELLLFYYEKNKEKFWNYVLKFLSDVEMIDGVPYLILDSQGSLAELFCDDRREISRDTIEELLNGEYENYGWSSYDLTDNIYRDVIEELTKENLRNLKEYIVKGLERDQIETSTELLESIAQNQGHPDYVIIDQSNIDQIVDDEETMKELLNNELSELNSNLYSIYSNAYQSAYEDELYEDVWQELAYYFDIEKRQWVSRPHVYKKDTEVQKFKVPILGFEKFVTDYLNSGKGYGSYSTLEYWGSYVSMLKEEINCLSFRVPDYADSRIVDKNINMYFPDYI